MKIKFYVKGTDVTVDALMNKSYITIKLKHYQRTVNKK